MKDQIKFDDIKKQSERREQDLIDDHKADVMELNHKLKAEREQYTLLNDNMQVLTRRIQELELNAIQKEKQRAEAETELKGASSKLKSFYRD
jgi:hypothetical protein